MPMELIPQMVAGLKNKTNENFSKVSNIKYIANFQHYKHLLIPTFEKFNKTLKIKTINIIYSYTRA